MVSNGDYIRNNYMKDNTNMAQYLMCLGCEYNDNCLESVKDMIDVNEHCNIRYKEWLEFLNKESKLP